MLYELLARLQAHGPESLSGLAKHFHTDVAAMEGMLDLLERKGRIQRLENKCSRCKGCLEVKPEDVTIFQCTPHAAPPTSIDLNQRGSV